MRIEINLTEEVLKAIQEKAEELHHSRKRQKSEFYQVKKDKIITLFLKKDLMNY